jgi:hypothetical protein
LADWHPHPKGENNSLVPVVRDAGAPDEIADRFFESAPELPTPEPPLAADPGSRRVAIDSAAVRARRRYLMRYVAGAVGVAGVIGLAAIVRMTIVRDASAAANPRATSAIAASLPAAPDQPTRAPDSVVASDDPGAVAANPAVAANLPVAADPPAAVDPPTVADSPAAAQPATAAAVVEPTTAEAPAVAVVENPPPNSQAAADSRLAAANAKKESQRALDRGHLADSIEAGEESVAIDPTDADAWLILGAAYQQQGHFADARRCFASCAQQAKRGSRAECGALLR